MYIDMRYRRASMYLQNREIGCEHIYRINISIFEARGDICKSLAFLVFILVYGQQDHMDGLNATSENFSCPGKQQNNLQVEDKAPRGGPQVLFEKRCCLITRRLQAQNNKNKEKKLQKLLKYEQRENTHATDHQGQRRRERKGWGKKKKKYFSSVLETSQFNK